MPGSHPPDWLAPHVTYILLFLSSFPLFSYTTYRRAPNVAKALELCVLCIWHPCVIHLYLWGPVDPICFQQPPLTSSLAAIITGLPFSWFIYVLTAITMTKHTEIIAVFLYDKSLWLSFCDHMQSLHWCDELTHHSTLNAFKFHKHIMSWSICLLSSTLCKQDTYSWAVCTF